MLDAGFQLAALRRGIRDVQSWRAQRRPIRGRDHDRTTTVGRSLARSIATTAHGSRLGRRRLARCRWTRADGLAARRQRGLRRRRPGRVARRRWPRPTPPPRAARRHGVDRPLPAGRARGRLARRPSSSCTSWRSRMRSSPTSARSSSATTTRCSSCCARPDTSTRPRRSSSARSTSSSARTSCSPCATARRPTSVRFGTGSRASPTCCVGARGGALRDPRPGGRRLLPRRRGSRERHRRDRDRGLQRRPPGVAPHLRAVPRGRRVPAGDTTARTTCSRR